MKKAIFILLISSMGFLQAQDFDISLQSAAKISALKLNNNPRPLNVVVYPFYNEKKQHTDLSRLITDDFAVYLSEYRRHFKIYERSYLEQMMQEHQLNEEGLIDPSTAKKFGMMIAADVYITGNIMLIGTNIRLHVFGIDTQTGERVFSVFKRIPLDAEMAEFLGINDFKKRKSKEELYKSSNPDCATQQVGDFCFVNKFKERLTVNLYKLPDHRNNIYRSLSLKPGEKKCFKDLPKGSYKYIAQKSQIFLGDIIPKGEFYVKTCLSDYIIIR